MRFRLQKRIVLIICLLLPFWTGAGVCMRENAINLPLNVRLQAPAGETSVIVSTAVSGEYILEAFPDTSVSASVHSESGELAEGTLPLTVTLPKDAEITIRLSSGESFYFEIMRASKGRNIHSPILFSSESMDRTLTRAQDVHWFEYVAPEDGSYIFSVHRAVKSGVNAVIAAFDENGLPIGNAYTNQDSEGTLVTLKEGAKCLFRVSAEGDEIGSYTIKTASNDIGADVRSLSSLPGEIHLVTGEWERLSAELPEEYILFSSLDPSIASVTSSGIVTARREGKTVILARTFDGVEKEITVYADRAQVTGVKFTQSEISLGIGEILYPAYQVLPAYAANQNVSLTSSDETVVSVNENGLLTALGTGTAVITATTAEGSFTDELTVTVTKPLPVSRALVVGIASYEGARERTGCINTTQGMADALSRTSGENAGYLTEMQLDLTKDELFEAISNAFSGANEQDTSLLYVNCHGGVTGTTAWLEMRNGEKVTAMELERALRKIPGQVIVIIDCCNSGAFIGSASEPDAFASGMVDMFSKGDPGRNAFSSTKYHVLVSSSYDQNSYRLASSSPATEQNMSTVFARALTEGIGWNLIKDKPGTLKADLDKDRQVSLHEAWLYTLKKTMSYLNRSTARQTVQVWPRGDTFTILK